jgi:hypothetical protein
MNLFYLSFIFIVQLLLNGHGNYNLFFIIEENWLDNIFSVHFDDLFFKYFVIEYIFTLFFLMFCYFNEFRIH